MTRYVLDRSVRRVGDGRVLIGGSPLKVLSLTPAGARLVERIVAGDDVALSAAEQALLDRFVDAGVLHPHPVGHPSRLDVTAVVPAFDPDRGALVDLVGACRAAGATAVIVVDDASPTPLTDIDGATVVRHDVNRGPGAARMTGLDHVTTPLVAFVDTDIVLGADWLAPLTAHFADERVAVVAPRVAAVPGRTTLARYESLHSPLDLGGEPARVVAGSRVGYVPSAVVVARVAAVRVVGGFDPSMRVGEDVDLVWRLVDAGHRVRYEPASVVHHHPRHTWVGWLRQRGGYGSSAAPLARRHPGALAPVRVSGWSAAAWSTAVLGWPVAGAAIALGTTVALARKLRTVPDGARQAARLGGLGNVFAGRALASAVTRAWWPIAIVGATLSKRVRRAVAIAALAPPLLDWIRTRPPIDPLTYTTLRIADDLAYGVGVIRGVVAERSTDALRPDFRSWPGRRPG